MSAEYCPTGSCPSEEVIETLNYLDGLPKFEGATLNTAASVAIGLTALKRDDEGNVFLSAPKERPGNEV